NLSVSNNNVLLAIERRHYPVAKDTICLNLTGTGRQPYRFEIIPAGLESGTDAFLEDNYLRTRYLVSANDTTTIDFTINSDAASSAPDRFHILFEAAEGPLPVTFTNARAYLTNENIEVEWSVDNETGIRSYNVEKSLEGSRFVSNAEIVAKNTPAGSGYHWLDAQPAAGNNYYRIRTVSINGEISYSKILVVFAGNLKRGITVYPNPVVRDVLRLFFNSQPKGNYSIRLINKLGQVILLKEIQRNAAGSSTETIPLNGQRTRGVYRLEVIKPDGSSLNINIIL
ncbi:MAG: T9SS type A sorting domain-containing protein, partial [Ginsengibacter sp.]